MATNLTQPILGIDTHAHIFRSDLPMAENRRYAPEYNALASSFIDNLDAHQLSHGVLVQPSFLGTDNRFMLDALHKYAGRLKGIAVVDPSISDADLDMLDSSGVVGVRFNLINKQLEDYSSPRWRAFLSKIQQRNWAIEIQRGIEDLSQILPSILAAGVEVIVDHYGRTTRKIDPNNKQHTEFLALLKSNAIWTKISAPYRCHASLSDAEKMLEVLREAYGHSDRLLWGSDWPHTQFEQQTNYSAQYEILTRLLPDAEERNKVLIHNPASRFRFQF
ncbi:MAG: amidohydrolase family protein [Marinomonas sp.]|uniref:amidohydrolase family protein n=1 Tax=Marinomonas sp. TaxID=1904862 RepID=UPI003C75A3EA